MDAHAVAFDAEHIAAHATTLAADKLLYAFSSTHNTSHAPLFQRQLRALTRWRFAAAQAAAPADTHAAVELFYAHAFAHIQLRRLTLLRQSRSLTYTKWRSQLHIQRSCCDRALGCTRDCIRRSIKLPTLSRSLALGPFLPMRVQVLDSPMRPVWKNSKQDGDPVTLMKITCDVTNEFFRSRSGHEIFEHGRRSPPSSRGAA